MALTQCRECRKDVSTEAASCPHCGVPGPAPASASPSQSAGASPFRKPPPLPPQAPAQESLAKVTYDSRSDVFRGTMPLMVKLAVKAVQTVGYKVESVNETVGLVIFETGMTWGSWSGVSGSLTIEEGGGDVFRVSGAGKQNVRGGQVVAPDLFGEARGKINKVIAKMKELAR